MGPAVSRAFSSAALPPSGNSRPSIDAANTLRTPGRTVLDLGAPRTVLLSAAVDF